ncbi:hypothetical protein MD484_g7355, partial [Candolleomyces efflorescens]
MSSTTAPPTERPLQDLYSWGVPHVNGGLGRITEGLMTKGDGTYVEYADGKRMLDFTCGIGVTNLGHAHPRVSGAAAEQCMKLVHSQCSIALHEPYLRLIEGLLPLMPHSSLDSFFFWNSGSEAVEMAIKMSRLFTKKQNIICMGGGYHGRTYGAMAVTKSKTIYSEGTGPLMPGVFSIPYPYWHQCGLPQSTPTSEITAFCLERLSLLLAQQTSPSDTAAIIIEPVLGEGGYVPAPPEFLQGLRKVCDEHDIILIIDEVQSGMGRTGDWWAVKESGVKPDILLTAKGLGNGFPISGIITRKELSDTLKKGSMGGTYAGNAVSCAAATEVVKVFKDDRVLENVKAREKEIFGALNALKQDGEVGKFIWDVRGKGLMVGLEFASGNAAPKSMAKRVADKCIEKGMLILTTSVFEVIRFIPPCNVSKADLEKGCKIFEEAVREVVREG